MKSSAACYKVLVKQSVRYNIADAHLQAFDLSHIKDKLSLVLKKCPQCIVTRYSERLSKKTTYVLNKDWSQ